MTVGERIREIRKEKGYSIRYLSELTGISRSTISRWENNQLNPSTEKVYKIIEAFDMTSKQFWEQPLGYVETSADKHKLIREQIKRITWALGDIQIAINVLRYNCGIDINFVQKLDTEDTIIMKKGIKEAATSVSRIPKEKEGICTDNYMEFEYDWCRFMQYEKKSKETHIYE